jgi:tRNA-dihydrouridine synthase A
MSADTNIDRRLCVAPMMAWTDRHCRYLLRLASPNALLFTEMVTASALLHGDTSRLLKFHAMEHPLALQIGGSDPRALADATRLGSQFGFDEINLNVGCPSPRVQRGRFGACLMLEPKLVAQCVSAMRDATERPVTVKCRLGVDDADSDDLLHEFVAMLRDNGCDAVYLHARKALLNGLTPAQNREVPPLQPQRVYQIKSAFPDLPVIFNGGVREAAAVTEHLQSVDGVMIGRAAYQSPQFVAELDSMLFGTHPAAAAFEDTVVQQYLSYIDRELAQGVRLHDMTRHMLGLFKGRGGARLFRRLLSDTQRISSNDISVVHEALAAITRRAA